MEPRRAAAGFVTGLLADLEMKTCWQVAEHAGHTTRSSVPARVHHLACFDRWYLALAQGIKTYELRRTDDRDFQRGDFLRITNSDDPDAVELWYLVTHVRAGDEHSGIRPGRALLSTRPTEVVG